MLAQVMPQERDHIWFCRAGGAIAFLVLAALAAAQEGAGLPGSDRRSAIERWAPAPADVILSERLRSMPREMHSVSLAGAGQKGTSTIVDGQLELRLDEPDTMMAMLSANPTGGPFVAEVDFDQDLSAALVLVREKDGKPDPDNYTSICVATDANGQVTATVQDRQNGRADVLDSRFVPPGGGMGPSTTQSAATRPATSQAALAPMDAAYRARFSAALVGRNAMPAKPTSGKLRIFRDYVSGMIRFYCEIRPEILGEACTGFVEVQPSPEWDNYKGLYYVGPAIRTSGAPSAARFHDFRIFRASRSDRDDRTTGFKVLRRDYNFSGLNAEGLVVSFGRCFPFRDADRKLVFWSAANYVPLWHLDDHLGLSYESIETWGDAKDGSYGPMSDRLLRFSRVSVTRDNAVRKRIVWDYTLLNQDYVPWGQKQGAKKLPEVEEVWTIYPDGLILREQRYYPATDGSARLQSNQVAGLAVMVGTNSILSDLLAEDAVTITGLSGKETRLRRPGAGGDFVDSTAREPAAVVTARFNMAGVPDVFMAYSQDARLSAAPPLALSVSSQRCWVGSQVSPSGQTNEAAANSQAAAPGQITLAGLICLGATQSANWSQDYLTDREGRKYRRWITLLGLEKQGDTAAAARRAACWVYGASVTDARGCRYTGYDLLTMEHHIWVDPGRDDCSFVMKPAARNQVVVRPVIRVEGWGERIPEVRVTGIPLRAGEDMEAAVESGELIIWINREMKGPTKITLAGQ